MLFASPFILSKGPSAYLNLLKASTRDEESHFSLFPIKAGLVRCDCRFV